MHSLVHIEKFSDLTSCVCTLQLLPLLASALEFGSAAAPALNPLLKMGTWLPQDEFNSKVFLDQLHNPLSDLLPVYLPRISL